jgi:hypothetical protein
MYRSSTEWPVKSIIKLHEGSVGILQDLIFLQLNRGHVNWYNITLTVWTGVSEKVNQAEADNEGRDKKVGVAGNTVIVLIVSGQQSGRTTQIHAVYANGINPSQSSKSACNNSTTFYNEIQVSKYLTPVLRQRRVVFMT